MHTYGIIIETIEIPLYESQIQASLEIKSKISTIATCKLELNKSLDSLCWCYFS